MALKFKKKVSLNPEYFNIFVIIPYFTTCKIHCMQLYEMRSKKLLITKGLFSSIL